MPDVQHIEAAVGEHDSPAPHSGIGYLAFEF
jgi:hypothetical protein